MAKFTAKALKVLVAAATEQSQIGEAVYQAVEEATLVPASELKISEKVTKVGTLYIAKITSQPELAEAEFNIGWHINGQNPPAERLGLIKANGAYVFLGIAVRDTDGVKKGRKALLARPNKPKVFKPTT